MTRRIAVALLVALAWIALALAPVAVWARAQVLETNRWVAVAAPLSREPVVHAAVADWATGELVRLVRESDLRVPLAGPLTRLVHDRVTQYLGTDEFSALWATAIARVHRTALRVLEGDAPGITAGAAGVTIDLRPLLQGVLDRITDRVELPEDVGRLTVYDHGRLRTAQDGLRRLGDLVALVVVLALVLPLAAIALSPRRGRTLVLLVAGTLVGAVLVRRGVARLGDDVLDRIHDPGGRAVADRVIVRLVQPLTTALGGIVAVTLGLLLVGAAVSVLGRLRPGPSPTPPPPSADRALSPRGRRWRRPPG